MVPSVDQVTGYFHSVEQYVVSTVSAASPDLPNMREAMNRLWDDMSRFGPPSLSDIKNKIPVLGDFELPPPPPPPPQQLWYERAANWANDNRWTIVGAGTGVVGVGLLAGYASAQARSRARVVKLKAMGASERRQVIVLLGGDHPHALHLIHELERKGYIVVASVESADYGQELERKCHGFVRAITLDPSDSATIPQFLRTLASTLSRRFPINASGDPHVSPSLQPYIYSIISLLSLPHPAINAPSIAGPLEHLPLETYLAFLQRTHLTPLQVIQSLLPLLRTSPARTRDKAERTIIMCLPAADSHTATPFSGAAAMSTAANLRAADVLRREVAIAASGPQGEGMKRLRVVTVDVGSVGLSPSSRRREEITCVDPSTVMKGWTNSEKATYGSAFLDALEEGRLRQLSRVSSSTRTFVNKLVRIIDDGQTNTISISGYILWRVGQLLRRDRVAVGAGARTYALASGFPPFILDILLNIPSILIGIRNALLPIQPYIRPPVPASATARTRSGPSTPGSEALALRKQITAAADESSLSETESVSAREMEPPRRAEIVSDVETGSEADVESNTEHDSGAEGTGREGAEHATGMNSMTSSWVNLTS